MVPVIDVLYLTNIAVFSAFLGWLGFNSCTRRRRGDYDVYEGAGFVVINEQTGEVVQIELDTKPRLSVCVHYASGLRNVAWMSRQSVVAQVEVLDCGVARLGAARTAVVHRGGTAPKWSGERGMVVVALPARTLDLARLELRVKLFCRNSLSPDTLLAEATLGTASEIANGLPREVALSPQGTLTFSAATANVNANDTMLRRDLPVAIAEPMRPALQHASAPPPPQAAAAAGPPPPPYTVDQPHQS